jgi:hypothetical protein
MTMRSDPIQENIKGIEYRSGFLREGLTTEDLPMQKWSESEMPSDVRKAIIREDLLSLGGVYGEKASAEPTEYDHLGIILDDGRVDIEVFGRLQLVSSHDSEFMRIHRVLCKLNKAMMSVPDSFTPEQQMGVDPRLPLPPGAKFTYRDQANVLTLLAFRNGPIEDLHAGMSSPLMENPKLSRITDEEMKTLMIAASKKLAELLTLRDSDPDAFAELLAGNWRQVKRWER